jgi:putative membrane protein
VKYLKLAYLGAGIALFALILIEIDLSKVWARIDQVGWGLLFLFAIYFVAFAFDVVSWCLTLTRIPPTALWMYRLWKVRMVGEAFNNLTPFASLGGEPVKAIILKSHYDIGYREGIASLVLARTTFMIALVLFLAIGFALMIGEGSLSAAYKGVAGVGLAAFTLGIAGLFLVQRHGVPTRAAARILPAGVAARLGGAIEKIRAIEEDLAHFYKARRGRFAGAVLFAFANWVLGTVELYVAMILLGHQVSWAEAWIIESLAQLIRVATFFVPAGIGVQEGTFIVVTAAMTGSPTLGLAVALVRRIREAAWIAWGLLVAGMYQLRQPIRRDDLTTIGATGDAARDSRSRETR